MKPFLGPIFDLFEGIVLHKPYTVKVSGGQIVKDNDGLEHVRFTDVKPDIAVVTKHRKPNVYNFNHKLK